MGWEYVKYAERERYKGGYKERRKEKGRGGNRIG
jgi:hypothetical protein